VIPGQDAWAPFYLDYKGLKKVCSSRSLPRCELTAEQIINSLAQGRPEDAALLAQGIRPAPRLPAELQLLPESNESVLMQTHRAAFFFKLEREIEKVRLDFVLVMSSAERAADQ
jgi:CDK inhibitor PHO81